jgi:hypothetical protein
VGVDYAVALDARTFLLPPASPGQTLTLWISQVLVPGQAFGSAVVVDGDWRFEVVADSSLEQGLWRQELTVGLKTAELARLDVRSVRSQTGTLVSYNAPHESLRLEAPVMLTAEGDSYSANVISIGEGRMLALFPPTEADSAVSVSFGPIAYATDPGNASSATYELASALGRDPTELPRQRDLQVDLANGNPESLGLAVSFELDFRGDPLIVLEIAGNWHPEFSSLQILDANGQPIDIRDTGVSYDLDEDGWSTPGVTTLRFVQNETQRDMSRLTIYANGLPGISRVVTASLVP